MVKQSDPDATRHQSTRSHLEHAETLVPPARRDDLLIELVHELRAPSRFFNSIHIIRGHWGSFWGIVGAAWFRGGIRRDPLAARSFGGAILWWRDPYVSFDSEIAGAHWRAFGDRWGGMVQVEQQRQQHAWQLSFEVDSALRRRRRRRLRRRDGDGDGDEREATTSIASEFMRMSPMLSE